MTAEYLWERLFSVEHADLEGRTWPASVSVTGARHYFVAIKLRWADQQPMAEAKDAFSAFCKVREELSARGLLPRCYAASRNVVLSSMCYQMSSGLKGYLVRMGQPALLADLVRIFDVGPSMDLVSVREQQEFKRAWLRSLGLRA